MHAETVAVVDGEGELALEHREARIRRKVEAIKARMRPRQVLNSLGPAPSSALITTRKPWQAHLSSMNLCARPEPCKSLNPVEGVLDVPVTNCSKRACFSVGHPRTHVQNHRTTEDEGE